MQAARVLAATLTIALAAALAPVGPALASDREPASAHAVTATGNVFDPNPVVTLGDSALADPADRTESVLRAAYVMRPLEHLDGSGYLRGAYADVRGSGGAAHWDHRVFDFSSSDRRFGQVMAYYGVTRSQEYIRNLGFTRINAEPQAVRVDKSGRDASGYVAHKDEIDLGKGGIDDAQDLEVIWRMYGLAVLDDQAPGFGAGHDAASIRQGFADYWAATMSEPVSDGVGVACIGEWNAIVLVPGPPFCQARVDSELTMADANGDPAHDGQIWARALWDIHVEFSRPIADTFILASLASLSRDSSFYEAARATVDSADRIGGRNAARVVRKFFQARGIL